MPFGIVINKLEFKKRMYFVQEPLVYYFVIIHVNDILIISEHVRSNYNHLRQLFEKFRVYNVTGNKEKSKIFITKKIVYNKRKLIGIIPRMAIKKEIEFLNQPIESQKGKLI